jgi:hypothetical protein
MSTYKRSTKPGAVRRRTSAFIGGRRESRSSEGKLKRRGKASDEITIAGEEPPAEAE